MFSFTGTVENKEPIKHFPSLLSDSLILQRHEVELEKRVTSIHSVSLCVFGTVFFQADWSKTADFYSTFNPVV